MVRFILFSRGKLCYNKKKRKEKTVHAPKCLVFCAASGILSARFLSFRKKTTLSVAELSAPRFFCFFFVVDGVIFLFFRDREDTGCLFSNLFLFAPVRFCGSAVERRCYDQT